MNLARIRKLFPVTKNVVFMNHAGCSPLPNPVSKAMMRCVEHCRLGEWPTKTEIQDVKKNFAKLISANPSEIGFVANTSYGINLVAASLRYKNGDNVVIDNLEYPSNVYPWLRLHDRRVKVKRVRSLSGRLEIEDFERLVDSRTRVVAVSHVQWPNGFKVDLRRLAKIAHTNGAYLFVDAIQSVGALEVDVQREDVDFLSCATYKWLLGPTGTGFLYVRKRLIKELNPCFVGWASVQHTDDESADLFYAYDVENINYQLDARRFEIGTAPQVCIAGAGAATRMLLEYGPRNVERNILRITDYLIDRLRQAGFTLQTPLDKSARSGIVNFKLRNPVKVGRELRKRGVFVAPRMGGLRVSPHYYNTEDEVDFLLREVKKL